MHSYIHFKEYERITWVDEKNKKWIIGAPDGSDSILLWTQKSSQEITKAREARAKQNQGSVELTEEQKEAKREQEMIDSDDPSIWTKIN